MNVPSTTSMTTANVADGQRDARRRTGDAPTGRGRSRRCRASDLQRPGASGVPCHACRWRSDRKCVKARREDGADHEHERARRAGEGEPVAFEFLPRQMALVRRTRRRSERRQHRLWDRGSVRKPCKCRLSVVLHARVEPAIREIREKIEENHQHRRQDEVAHQESEVLLPGAR